MHFTLSSSCTKAGASSTSPKYIGFVISTLSVNRAWENGCPNRLFLRIKKKNINYVQNNSLILYNCYLNKYIAPPKIAINKIKIDIITHNIVKTGPLSL